MLSVDDSHNKVIWPYLGSGEKRFWVLCYLDGNHYRPVVAEAARVIQEAYIHPDASIPEDVLTVFTSSDAAILYVAAIGRELGTQANENIRFVAMGEDKLMEFLGSLDTQYLSRQNALRVDICDLKKGDLRREILYSRQIPKH